MQQDKFVNAARSMIGTPWKHQGRTPGLALDCIGILVCAAKEAGMTMRDQNGYSRRPDGSSLRAAMVEHFEEVEAPEDGFKQSDLELGNILLFKLGPHPRHVGIYEGNGRFIHSWATGRRVCSVQLSADWLKNIVARYRVENEVPRG